MEHHDLYRFFDSEDRLLYIGISLHAATRASQHKRDKEWWVEVARMEVEHLGPVGRSRAQEIELDAIRSEIPLHNVVGNGPAALRRPASKGANYEEQCYQNSPWACELCGSRFGFGNLKGRLAVHDDGERYYWAGCESCWDDGSLVLSEMQSSIVVTSRFSVEEFLYHALKDPEWVPRNDAERVSFAEMLDNHDRVHSGKIQHPFIDSYRQAVA